MTKFFSLDNKWFTRSLFALLCCYLLLRALFVEPLLDELSTLYWFVEPGKILGPDAMIDANNHLLNTYITRFLYLLFGDHFLVYRLFALLTFPLYFFATLRLVKKTVSPKPAVLVFLALNTIHWVFDYFGFSRGYGPSLAFFFAALSLAIEWKTTLRPRTLLLIVILLILSLLSNLSLFVPAFFLLAYLALVYLIRWKSAKTWKNHLLTLFCFVLYFASCLPIYAYLNILKKAGALWWGSREGLWEVTGKSLCNYVVYNDHGIWGFILVILFISCLFILIRMWIRTSLRDVILSHGFFILGILFLSVCSAVFLAHFMEINYPMDRVAMYMVPLFLLALGILFSESKVTRYFLLLYLWFPLSFIARINLDTSVFSPEDRIHRTFYAKIKTLVKATDILSADYATHTSYTYLARQEPQAHIAIELSNDTLTRGDYHIAWKEPVDWKGYRLVLTDPVSKTKLYKKENVPGKTLAFDTVIPLINSSEEFISFLQLDLKPFKGKFIHTECSAEMETDGKSLNGSIFHNIENEQHAVRVMSHSIFSRYFGYKKQYRFFLPNHDLKIADDDLKLYLFLYNGDKTNLKVKNVKIKVFVRKTTI